MDNLKIIPIKMHVCIVISSEIFIDKNHRLCRAGNIYYIPKYKFFFIIKNKKFPTSITT